MEWPGLGVDASVEQYLEFLGSLRRDMPDVTVKLFGFQSSIVRDDLLVERIIREGELVEVADCSYQGDAETFLQEYATCSGILATRFHAGVLALGLGIPMVQLAYSHKIIDFLLDIGWQGDLWCTEPNLMGMHASDIVTALEAADAVRFVPREAALHAAVPATRRP